MFIIIFFSLQSKAQYLLNQLAVGVGLLTASMHLLSGDEKERNI